MDHIEKRMGIRSNVRRVAKLNFLISLKVFLNQMDLEME
jgi:hypothetical protein